MKFGERLKSIRQERGLSQEELAGLLATSKQVISRYENNQRTPRIDVANGYASALGVPLEYLLGDDTNSFPAAKNILPLPKMKEVPLLGTIACGLPILAQENIEAYVGMPEGVRADFCLRCQGDSMINARIYDGDVVFIKQQPTVENGEIAAVLIGEEATLKRVYLSHNKVMLVAENPAYEPLVYVNEELEEIRIIGKAVAFLSDVR